MAVSKGTQETERAEEIKYQMQEKFTIGGIPRNIHSTRDGGRCRLRHSLGLETPERGHVDTSGPAKGVATIAVTKAYGEVIRVASVQQAEEAAIALAVNCNSRATVMADLQKAYWNYARGILGRRALCILKKSQIMGIHVIWAPGHMGHTENRAANAGARAALAQDSSPCPEGPSPDAL